MAIVVAVGLCLIRGMNDEIISSGKNLCKGSFTLIENEMLSHLNAKMKAMSFSINVNKSRALIVNNLSKTCTVGPSLDGCHLCYLVAFAVLLSEIHGKNFSGHLCFSTKESCV